MKHSKLVVIVLVLSLAVPAVAQVTYLENISYRLLTPETANTPAEVGMWEYVYDLQGNGGSRLDSVTLSGFDTSLIVNTNASGALNQKWDWAAANNDGWWGGCNGSISYDGATWTVADPTYELDNIWHDPADYWGYIYSFFGPYPGFLGTGSVSATDVFFQARVNSGNTLDGLLLTFRIVHPHAPGDVDWSIRSFSAGNSGTVIGPAAPVSRLGDFDGDGDIDADDIDALGAAIQAGSTDTDFDMDGDGDVDADDFDMHVTTLVDTALGEGTGTAFGDFNLDGMVGILDLGLLGDGYSQSLGWANGDANGDGTVGILDLGLLGDNYGYDGSAIPEPATMSLLALGAIALIRRKK